MSLMTEHEGINKERHTQNVMEYICWGGKANGGKQFVFVVDDGAGAAGHERKIVLLSTPFYVINSTAYRLGTGRKTTSEKEKSEQQGKVK